MNIPIFVRTRFNECFSTFLSQLINFSPLYFNKLIIIKNGSPTNYQKKLINILKKKMWEVRIVKNNYNEGEALWKLVDIVGRKYKQFFIIDDDMLFKEWHFVNLIRIGRRYKNYNLFFYATVTPNLEFSKEVIECKNQLVLPDFRPLYIKNIKLNVKDFEELRRDKGKGFGYLKFIRKIVEICRRAIMVIDNPELLPIHMNFEYEFKVWSKVKDFWSKEKISPFIPNNYKLRVARI